jgi:signal transduction histidine kinase
VRGVVPTIASAFQRIQLEDLIKRRADIFDSEQERIARDVHDTLGHSLVHLRLKLDHVLTEINQAERGMLRSEIEALSQVAKDAYGQMRDVLVDLNPESASDLVDHLQIYADKIRPRANFKLQVSSYGQQCCLPAPVRHHIFFIFQEALTNIEKHAQAGQVDVDLRWQEACLEMTITDDGAGFDTAVTIQNGHYGLRNMRQRALESDAQLAVFSQAGRGTRILLRVPYEAG